MHPGKEKLKQILDGLEGVTPGPWHKSGVRTQLWEHEQGFSVGTQKVSIFFVPAGKLGSDPKSIKDHQGAIHDSKHIARCNPDTMREVAEWAFERDDRATALEAENARLRKALDKINNKSTRAHNAWIDEGRTPVTSVHTISEIRDIARAALAQEPPEK